MIFVSGKAFLTRNSSTSEAAKPSATSGFVTPTSKLFLWKWKAPLTIRQRSLWLTILQFPMFSQFIDDQKSANDKYRELERKYETLQGRYDLLCAAHYGGSKTCSDKYGNILQTASRMLAMMSIQTAS